MSIFRGNFQHRASAIWKRTRSILLRRAFLRAVEIAIGSISIPITRFAPRHFAARARMPLPVPISTTNSRQRTRRGCSFRRPRRKVSAVENLVDVRCAFREDAEYNTRGAGAPQNLVSCSSSRSDMTVVGCSPVPKAAPAGITRSRPPSFSGLAFFAWAKRSYQPGARVTILPPNFCISSSASRRDLQATSRRARLRSGRVITAAWLRALGGNSFCRTSILPGSTSLRQR